MCDDTKKYFKLAVDFHFKLAELSGNKMFYMIWKLFYDIFLKAESIMKGMYSNPIPNLLNANKAMLEAIKSKDPDQIDKAMKIHAEEELHVNKKRTNQNLEQ